MKPRISSYSYATEDDAFVVAEWLANLCEQEVGGGWQPRVHENLGWHASAVLGIGKPCIADMRVYLYGDRLAFSGGFLAEPGKPGCWKQGDVHDGRSPFEVIHKSYRAIKNRAQQAQARVEAIEALDLTVSSDD